MQAEFGRRRQRPLHHRAVAIDHSHVTGAHRTEHAARGRDDDLVVHAHAHVARGTDYQALVGQTRTRPGNLFSRLLEHARSVSQVSENPQPNPRERPDCEAAVQTYGPAMDDVWHRQTSLMDRSGLGLLPGIALAFIVALFLIGAITLHTWWAVGIGLIGSIGGAVAVIVIVMKTVMSEPGENE